jgi:ABC-type antimicrobial peptide transport system permease subunit
LAAAGRYALLSEFLGQRREELAIRIALGAEGSDLVNIFFGQSAPTIVSGIAIGVVLSLLSARATSALHYGVRPLDPIAFVGGVAIMASIAVAAVVVNSYRPSRVDPATSLRS